jgi:hypothetical protein
MIAAGAADAQVINGSNNGNGNTGTGNGNGNGNGNGSFNTTTSTSGATAGGSNSSVTLNGKRNTPSVLAPGLAAAGIETCLGSTSVGGSGPGFGVTIAGTTTDRSCNLRLYSRTLYSMGHKLAATQILCNDPDVAAALALEGVHCLVGPVAEAEAHATANARAEAKAPPEATMPPEATIKAPPEATIVRGSCRNWVLFRGCMDEPEPDAVQAAAPAMHALPRSRTKLATVEHRASAVRQLHDR